jgi:hypothetical protein
MGLGPRGRAVRDPAGAVTVRHLFPGDDPGLCDAPAHVVDNGSASDRVPSCHVTWQQVLPKGVVRHVALGWYL